MYLIFLLKYLITHQSTTPPSPLRLDSSLKGKRGENRWRRYRPLRHISGGKTFHQTTTYSFISSDLDSRSRLASLPLCSFVRIPVWVARMETAASSLPGPTIGSEQRPESSWPPPRGPDDLGRSSARPHQGAAALQILRVNFYDKCLCKVMHIDIHLFCFLLFLLSLSFSSGSKGRMCQTVMYLVWWSPQGIFFLLFLLLLNDQHFIGEKFFFSLWIPIKRFFRCR